MTISEQLRYAVRTLWRAPGFSAMAVALLCLGIAATSAVFSPGHDGQRRSTRRVR